MSQIFKTIPPINIINEGTPIIDKLLILGIDDIVAKNIPPILASLLIFFSKKFLDFSKKILRNVVEIS